MDDVVNTQVTLEVRPILLILKDFLASVDRGIMAATEPQMKDAITSMSYWLTRAKECHESQMQRTKEFYENRKSKET